MERPVKERQIIIPATPGQTALVYWSSFYELVHPFDPARRLRAVRLSCIGKSLVAEH